MADDKEQNSPASTPSLSGEPPAPVAAPSSEVTEAGDPSDERLALEIFDAVADDSGDDSGFPTEALVPSPEPGSSPPQASPPATGAETASPANQGDEVTQVVEPVQAAPAQTGQVAQPSQQAVAPQASNATEDAVKPARSPEEGFRELAAQIEAKRPQIIDAVASSAYKLSDDELAEINASPEVGIPKLAAKIHVNAVQGVLAHVAQQIPAVVAGILEARERYSRLENKFYEAWPQLDKAKHGATVNRLAGVWRQANPEATYEDMVQMVGAQAMVALKLPFNQTPAAVKPPVQQQRPALPRGFQPAVNGNPSPPVQNPAPKNLFELYDQLIEAEEQGAFDQ